MKHLNKLLGPALGLSILGAAAAISVPMPPPPEAVEACSGESEGAFCSFVPRHGEVTGICRELKEQTACVPDIPPGGGRGDSGRRMSERPPCRGAGGPPPEAFSACRDKADGDVCRVQTPHESLGGHCYGHGEAPFCIPDAHGRPPQAAGPILNRSGGEEVAGRIDLY